MLLQDSLGGSSLAMMFACVSPVDIYSEETVSTLNYASRVMNIKNKPVVQMGQKDQIIMNLKREIELFKMENKWLKTQLNKISGGEFEIESSVRSLRNNQNLPPLHEGDNVDFDNGSTRSIQHPNSMGNANLSRSGQRFNNANVSQSQELTGGGPQSTLNDKLLKEFNFEIGRLRSDNNQFRTKNM